MGLLEENGMFPDQAKTVMDGFIQDPASEAMVNRWDDDMSGYPDMMFNILWVSLKDYAYKWLDENLPNAWFKPMFKV
jgi:hypothetical protein